MLAKHPMTGKIAHLPPAIQDQLNQRLEKGEEAKTILPWLNSLPEVQAVLQAQFEGLAINPQNLSDHRNRGFLDWQDREAPGLHPPLRTAGQKRARTPALRWLRLRCATLDRPLPSRQGVEADCLQPWRQSSQIWKARRLKGPDGLVRG
jgi:hypothetical protein